MLRRKALESLRRWRTEKDRKPLLVEGPRQVGKTFIIRVFAREAYETVYELNFLMNPSAKTVFTGDLSADVILAGIRLNHPGVPYIPGKTLIFLDEIQACPEAITALKFLAHDNRFDVIASGSSLGIVHAQTSSWPVGQIDYLDMWSLDFEEFLWAVGIDDDLIETVRTYRTGERVIPEGIHRKMTEYLRQYLVIGGMPETVNNFIIDSDYSAADATQRRIYRDYTADIAHYAEPEIRLKAQACWESVPAQLSKDNHKFQYGVVEKRGTAAKFGSSVEWLKAARMVSVVHNVSDVKYPLKNSTMKDHFRLYPTDIGLLICTYDFSLKKALLKDYTDDSLSESIVFRTAKGGIMEALAAEMLCKRGFFDRCWFYRNETGNVEVEFLTESADGVIPIEIKSGNNKTRSLDRILRDDHIVRGYTFADQNAGISGKKITLPLYMLMFFEG